MRRIVLLIIIASTLLSGCGLKNDRFKVVEQYGAYEVIVDTETGIGYLQRGGGGITIMYDADGNIYRPNGWRDD